MKGGRIYRLLDESEPRVAEAAFGTMTFGDEVCPSPAFCPCTGIAPPAGQVPLSAAAP
jgi:hypothetical protein